MPCSSIFAMSRKFPAAIFHSNIPIVVVASLKQKSLAELTRSPCPVSPSPAFAAAPRHCSVAANQEKLPPPPRINTSELLMWSKSLANDTCSRWIRWCLAEWLPEIPWEFPRYLGELCTIIHSPEEFGHERGSFLYKKPWFPGLGRTVRSL